LLSVAAIVGDTVGYWFGAKTGPPLFSRPNSRFFKRDHLLKAHAFYEKHGGKTIVIARFMPLIRTFAPIVAGVAGMSYPRFVMYNVCGGIGWVTSMLLLGYGLGQHIPNIDQHVEKVIAVVIFLSILPGLIHFWKERRAAAARAAEAGETVGDGEP
jgi:membrane-associated protein